MQAVQRLGAEYLLRAVGLAVLDVALVARREYGHGLLAGDVTDVVVDVSGLLDVIGHHKQRLLQEVEGGEEHGRGAPGESRQRDAPGRGVAEDFPHGLDAPCRGEESVGFPQIHLRFSILSYLSDSRISRAAFRALSPGRM